MEKWDICQSLKQAPQEIFEQPLTLSGAFGTMWAADIIKSDRQLVFIARENLSNFTVTKLISNETASSIRDAIIQSTAELIPGEGLEMQVDNAPAMQSLVNDSYLARYHIHIRLARKKNKNGNPVAEKAVQEFKQEKLRFYPGGGAINDLDRALITASLNRRVRGAMMSAREQLSRRKANHPSSAKSKVPGGSSAVAVKVWPGALVNVKKDKSKQRARVRYIVVKLEVSSQC